jgi:hypothetical protein
VRNNGQEASNPGAQLASLARVCSDGARVRLRAHHPFGQQQCSERRGAAIHLAACACEQGPLWRRGPCTSKTETDMQPTLHNTKEQLTRSRSTPTLRLPCRSSASADAASAPRR